MFTEIDTGIHWRR